MIFHNEIITSRNNTTVKWASSLSEKKGREASRAFLAEGAKLTFEALDASLPVSYIFICEDRANEYLERIKNYNTGSRFTDTEVFIVCGSAFEKISTEKAPQGIISVIKYLDFFSRMDIIYKEEFFLKSTERAIFLSSVRDPGNLGAVIRSSVAFGVEHIILSSDCADIYNPKTVRSAMGSLFRVKVTSVSDVSSFIISARENGRRVFSSELKESAISLNDLKLSSGDIFVIGNEGHGISRDISEKCTGSVYIPISKKTESLNASVAAALFMWEQSKL